MTGKNQHRQLRDKVDRQASRLTRAERERHQWLAETVFDTLTLKACLYALHEYADVSGQSVPLMISHPPQQVLAIASGLPSLSDIMDATSFASAKASWIC